MSTDTDRLAHWLVSGLELDTTIFHVGQYCGPWRASTAGRERASFHLVLRGESWLHLEGQEPILLHEREGVFLLRDIPGDPSGRAGEKHGLSQITTRLKAHCDRMVGR